MTMANYKTRVSLLAISLVFALTALVPLTVSANGYGDDYENGSDYCSQGNQLLDKYEYKYSNGQWKYVVDGTSGNNVTITNGTKTGGNFSVVSSKIVYSVFIDAKYGKTSTVNYPSGVSGGSFDNTGTAEGKDIEKVAFCGKNAYYLQFDKKWVGDKIDTTKVDVVITSDKFKWELGDDAVRVEKGQGYYLTEVVTGLPENCTSTSDLQKDKYYPFPYQQYSNDSRGHNNGAVSNTAVKTVTNTVTCEDEGEVLGTTTTTTPPKTTTVASLPNTGSKVAAVAAILTAITTGAAMFSSTLRSALVKFTN